MSAIKVDQKRRSWGRTFGSVLLFLAIADQGISWMARDIFVPWTLNGEVRAKADWLVEQSEENPFGSRNNFCETKRFLLIFPYRVCFSSGLKTLIGSDEYVGFSLSYRGPFPFVFPPFFPNFNTKSYFFQETLTLRASFMVYVNQDGIFRTIEVDRIPETSWHRIELEDGRRIIGIDELELEKLL